jgi:hypothetical protein
MELLSYPRHVKHSHMDRDGWTDGCVDLRMCESVQAKGTRTKTSLHELKSIFERKHNVAIADIGA